jgi:hypothetical protein
MLRNIPGYQIQLYVDSKVDSPLYGNLVYKASPLVSLSETCFNALGIVEVARSRALPPIDAVVGFNATYKPPRRVRLQATKKVEDEANEEWQFFMYYFLFVDNEENIMTLPSFLK